MVALFNATLALASLIWSFALCSGLAALSAALSFWTFVAAARRTFKAAFLWGLVTDLRAFLISAIFALRTFDFFASTLAVCFLATAWALTNLALTAASLALRAFLSFGEA